MHLARAHSYKSVTCVFNYLKLILISFLAITSLTACTTFSNRTAAVAPITISELEVEYPTIDLIDAVAVEAPVLEVREISVPMEPLELHEKARIVMSDAEIRCMSDVIYHEAKSEPLTGQAAVGYVVLNRMGHDSYPKTACGVVYDRKHGCQFSWACGKTKVSTRRHAGQYEVARQVALDVMEGRVENPIGNVTQFRVKKLRAPRAMALYATIGNHNFFVSRQ